MNKTNSLTLTLTLVLLALFMVFNSTPSEAQQRHHHHRKLVRHPYSPTYAGLVMDAKTGEILYQKNANQALPPASLTKIMTLLLVFEALDKGKVTLNDRLIISAHAASMEPSKLGLRPRATITIKNAIYTVVTKSCNDIAVALAENLAGSEHAFTKQMSKRALELGMKHTLFANASGLPHPQQKSSAYDMAILARHIITTYPTYYRYFSTRNFSYAGQRMHNHNNLMNSYAGMDGVKSGYILQSGFNLVASAVRQHHRLIGVVFGGKTANRRNAEMARLLDSNFKKQIALAQIKRLKDKENRQKKLASAAFLPTSPYLEVYPLQKRFNIQSAPLEFDSLFLPCYPKLINCRQIG